MMTTTAILIHATMNNRQTESNPFLRKLDQIHDAKVKWASSEWLLGFLRSEASDKLKNLTDEELLIWDKNLR